MDLEMYSYVYIPFSYDYLSPISIIWFSPTVPPLKGMETDVDPVIGVKFSGSGHRGLQMVDCILDFFLFCELSEDSEQHLFFAGNWDDGACLRPRRPCCPCRISAQEDNELRVWGRKCVMGFPSGQPITQKRLKTCKRWLTSAGEAARATGSVRPPGRIPPGGSGRGIRRWPGRSRSGPSRGGSGIR